VSVSRIEISLPDQTYAEITRLVDQGEFLDEDKAFEELISMGMSAYDTTEEEPEEVDDEMLSQTFDDRTDPAMEDDVDDDPMF